MYPSLHICAQGSGAAGAGGIKLPRKRTRVDAGTPQPFLTCDQVPSRDPLKYWSNLDQYMREGMNPVTQELHAKRLDLMKTRRCFVDLGPPGRAPTPQLLAAKKRCYRLQIAWDCLQAVRTADTDRYEQQLAKTGAHNLNKGLQEEEKKRAHTQDEVAEPQIAT